MTARQELSVSDLAEALRQSEPRVSRHLRILCEAGLLERLRQGQWVHYRVTQSPAAASFVQGLLAQMDRNEPVFARDRERAFGRPMAAANTGVSLAADTYWSCVREYTSQCRYIRDEWESCGELSMDIRDMCRSMYPAPPRKRPHR